MVRLHPFSDEEFSYGNMSEVANPLVGLVGVWNWFEVILVAMATVAARSGYAF